MQSIQSATDDAVSAIQAIGGTISEIDEISKEIATAVEHQGLATGEISGSVQQAAEGARQVSQSMENVTQASDETGTSAARLLDAANGLSSESDRLKSEVGQFVQSLNAA